jgi:hypothetical protein
MTPYSIIKVTVPTEPGTARSVVTKYGKHTEIHALRQVAAKTLSPIIFSRAGNVGDTPCRNALHHDFALIRDTQFFLRHFHNKIFGVVSHCQ